MVSSEFLLLLIISSHNISTYPMHTYWSSVLWQTSFYTVNTEPAKAIISVLIEFSTQQWKQIQMTIDP